MKKLLFILPVMTLSGCLGLVPEGTTAEDIAAYEAATATIGCKMVGEPDYLAVEFQAGLTREQSTAITTFMLANDRAEKLPDGGVKITSGACA